MDTEIKGMLEDRIKLEFENLSTLEPGSIEHEKAVASLEKLYKLNVEDLEKERAFIARCDRDALDEREMQLKERQLEEQRKNRWFEGAIQVGLAVGGWIAYDIWQRRGYKFEETGVIRSPWLKNLVSRMMPKK